jgi:regulator of RNase E activity RraA
MHAGPGFRVNTDFSRQERKLRDGYPDLPAPDISDLLNGIYCADPKARCLTGPAHCICRPALTVKCFPGENLMVHKSLDIARPEDVVVIDMGRSTTNAVLGDLICAKAKHRGRSGFVVDRLTLNLPGNERIGMPVFARRTAPSGQLHRGPGEIN